MKKGINFWSFQNDVTVVDAMSTARDGGFEGIEFCLAAEGEISLQSTEAEIKAVRRQATDMNLEVASLASWLPWEYSLTSNIKDHRLKATAIVKKQIETAALLGTDTILLVPGYVGVDFVQNSEICSYDKVYSRAQEAIRELAEYANKFKITIGVENVWNKFLLSPLEMRSFIDEINLPNVGVYFDVANVLLYGYPEQWIKILGQRIKRVHFKDYRRDPGGFGAFVDLLAGDVNYPAVVEALEEIGYENYCTAEMMPPYKYYSDQIIYNTSASMDRILKLKS
jgi:L-ribulose-5-phosphate 3-epimerase